MVSCRTNIADLHTTARAAAKFCAMNLAVFDKVAFPVTKKAVFSSRKEAHTYVINL